MTRATRVAIIALVLTTIYLLVFFQVVSIPLVGNEIARQILPVIPWWLLVSSGSYALWCLGWGIFTFRDCPEAYTELLGEIPQAKNELRAQGVTVD